MLSTAQKNLNKELAMEAEKKSAAKTSHKKTTTKSSHKSSPGASQKRKQGENDMTA
jgi:hypothetical protein